MTFKKGRFNVKTPPRAGVTLRRTPSGAGVTLRRTSPRARVTLRRTPSGTGVTPRRTSPGAGVTPRITSPGAGVTPRRTPRQYVVKNNLTVTNEDAKMLYYLKSKEITTLQQLEYKYSECKKAERELIKREKLARSCGANIHGRKIRK